MKRWFYKMSLQKKMLYSYGILFIISLTALMIFFFRSFSQERTTEVAHMTQYNGQLSLNLDTMISGLDGFRYMHFSDDKIRNVISSDDSDIDQESYKETEEKLAGQLTFLTDMGNYVLRAVMVTADGRIYESVGGDNTDYLERMREMTGDIAWEKDTPAFFSEVHRENIDLVGYQVVTMVCPVWNVMGDDPAAIVYLDLDFNKISNQWYRSADVGQGTEFIVLSPSQILFDSGGSKGGDKDGATLFAGDLQKKIDSILQLGGQEGTLTLHGKRCVVSARKNESTGWYLVQYMPTSLLTGRIISSMSVILLILAGVIVATVIGSFILARQVSRPVKVLSQVMGKVARDSREEQQIPLFEEQEILWEDEVGQMIRSYNSMASRINNNIIKMYVYRLNQKQTELKMLQFQINPHFLYNALNTISAIARLEEVELIPEIASSLSDMFRYNINGNEIVTVREELEQTENYMNIQKIRFPGRFDIRYEVEKELLDCKILKFVLQPVVENAYKYGFSRKRQKDVLCIRGCREGKYDILLEVEDDGAGISADMVKELNERFRKAEFSQTAGEGGIGLRNVNARLKNYYGDDCGIRVESEEGQFTRVFLRIKDRNTENADRRAEDDSSSGGR